MDNAKEMVKWLGGYEAMKDALGYACSTSNTKSALNIMHRVTDGDVGALDQLDPAIVFCEWLRFSIPMTHLIVEAEPDRYAVLEKHQTTGPLVMSPWFIDVCGTTTLDAANGMKGSIAREHMNTKMEINNALVDGVPESEWMAKMQAFMDRFK